MSFTINKVEVKGASLYEPLEAGKYDATIHAIISLEQQRWEYLGKEKVGAKVLVLLEVPDVLRKNALGEELPALLNYEITFTPSEKGNFMKLVTAVNRKALDEDQLQDFMNSEDGIKSLLGKPVVVDVTAKPNKKGGVSNYVDSVVELDKRLPQPSAVRTPFLFTAANPDLDIFKNTLISWTRDKIMGAVNSDEFPKELHKAYRDIKDQEAANSTNRLV